MLSIRKIFVAAALGSACMIAAPASAAVFACSSGPGIDLTVDQCVAAGNDSLANVESAIADATGVDVSSLELSLYGKSDDNPGLFTFAPNANPASGKTTDWTVIDGTLIKYVTIKAANDFKVYELSGAGASSGLDFTSLGILNNGGKQPDISHLSFWAAPGAVPEPATWALMLLGFFAVGGAMRSAKAKQGTAVSFG